MKTIVFILFCMTGIAACNNPKTEDSVKKEVVEVEETPVVKTPVVKIPKSKKLPKNQGLNLQEMDNVTKGAVIGVIAGAATGAVVSKKNKGKGAVIGGVAGAGIGALTGAAVDKKNRDGKLFKNGLFGKKKKKK